MILTQDFDADFDLLTAGLLPSYSGEPYAFVRFADGETAIMRGKEYKAKSDGWSAPAGDCTPDHSMHWRLLGGGLIACLWAALPGFYMGITAHEHHPECHDWLMRNSGAAVEKISFAELFIFANYNRFSLLCDAFLSNFYIVSPHSCGMLYVPRDAVMTGWDHRPTVDALIDGAHRPILVSAGPLANIIIHDYWLRCPPARKQVILDVGSAITPQFQARKTRQYHHQNSPQRSWKPRFWPISSVAE